VGGRTPDPQNSDIDARLELRANDQWKGAATFADNITNRNDQINSQPLPTPRGLAAPLDHEQVRTRDSEAFWGTCSTLKPVCGQR